MGEDTDMCYFINWNWIITWWYGEKKKSINKLIFLHNLLEIGKTIKDECDVLERTTLLFEEFFNSETRCEMNRISKNNKDSTIIELPTINELYVIIVDHVKNNK